MLFQQPQILFIAVADLLTTRPTTPGLIEDANRTRRQLVGKVRIIQGIKVQLGDSPAENLNKQFVLERDVGNNVTTIL
ncbi:MAG: hypothetical protein A3J25_03850 [Pseudomonadales bacterium RIFCSPLOWO2_02_FULL_63_210]|nr:MAG: hypothetical protein A3J25_03850 [Pseudomonadales bacterium RIFCSPLOWO2_02_FULL_63_210]